MIFQEERIEEMNHRVLDRLFSPHPRSILQLALETMCAKPTKMFGDFRFDVDEIITAVKTV